MPTLPSLLSMVKVMDFALTEGRVAVHCHAGLGRTGVLIACYLTFSLRLSSEEAITTVRLKRLVDRGADKLYYQVTVATMCATLGP